MPQKALAIVNQSARWKPRIIEKCGGLSMASLLDRADYPPIPREAVACAPRTPFRRDAGPTTDALGIGHALSCVHRRDHAMAFRRDKTPGGTYFFTVVTRERRPALTLPAVLDALRRAVVDVRGEWPFASVAWVVLPDHLHVIWRLPDGDRDHSRRWGEIKRRTGRSVRTAHGPVSPLNASALRRHESGLWQRRYWEHRIRDDDDLRRHIDYIHFNPVKHGLVERAVDWPHSSSHAYVQRGLLTVEWGVAVDFGSFGE
jgi:putative transposase